MCIRDRPKSVFDAFPGGIVIHDAASCPADEAARLESFGVAPNGADVWQLVAKTGIDVAPGIAVLP